MKVSLFPEAAKIVKIAVKMKCRLRETSKSVLTQSAERAFY